MTGTTVITIAAVIKPYSVPYCELTCASNTTIGRTCTCSTRISDENKSLYDHRNTKIPTVPNTGSEIGKNTLKYIVQRLQPSITDASSSSFGMDAIYPLITKMANGRFPAVCGIINAQYVFTRSRPIIIL